jgi:hypothetical protein
VERRFRDGISAGEIPPDFPVAARASQVIDLSKGLTMRAQMGTPRKTLLRDAEEAADLVVLLPRETRHGPSGSARKARKRCAAVPQSLLDLRFQAVDLSIAGVPDGAVTWDDTDRLSTAIKLPDGRVVVAQRVFVEDPEDPMEGRQVRVILVGGPGKGKTLDDDCFTPERFKSRDGLIAFQCASEEAGDQLLHIVVVFDKDGKQLANVNNCRNPNLPNDATVTCSEESYPSANQDANTLAHEFGHIVNLAHRPQVRGDGLPLPLNENLMHPTNPPAQAQDLDVIQARAVHRSPLVPP